MKYKLGICIRDDEFTIHGLFRNKVYLLTDDPFDFKYDYKQFIVYDLKSKKRLCTVYRTRFKLISDTKLVNLLYKI